MRKRNKRKKQKVKYRKERKMLGVDKHEETKR